MKEESMDLFPPPAGKTAPSVESRTFVLPASTSNSFGWGPSSVPEEFKDIPFAPFNKNDQLSRASDWQNTRFVSNRTQNFAGEGGFAYKHAEDDDSFNLVDNTPKFKPKDGRRRYKKFSVSNRRRRGRGYISWGRRNGTQTKKERERRKYQQRKWNMQARAEEQQPNSVEIKETWELVDEFPLTDLEGKLSPAAPEEVYACGELRKYQSSYTRLTPRAPVGLQRSRYMQPPVSACQDPILTKLAKEGKADIYATDTILAVLMAAPKSALPWDIVVKKRNGKIILDKRKTSILDRYRVNENWNEIIDVEEGTVNHPDMLSGEHTMINRAFSQQVLAPVSTKTPAHDLGNVNVFDKLAGTQTALQAYRYRQWTIAGQKVLARTTLNGYDTKKSGKTIFLCTKALTEIDTKLSGGVKWRQQLERQTGAVLATAVKNDACKLHRWTAELELSGADEVRLGFVSRRNARANTKHDVLMSKTFKPSTFTTSVQTDPEQLWGALEAVVERLKDLEDGHYVLLREANEPKLMIFQTANDEFLLQGDM